MQTHTLARAQMRSRAHSNTHTHSTAQHSIARETATAAAASLISPVPSRPHDPLRKEALRLEM